MIDLVLAWDAFKVWLSASTGLPHHDYHLLLGVLLTLVLTRLLPLPLGTWRPLMLVLTLELLDEASYSARYYVDGSPLKTGVDAGRHYADDGPAGCDRTRRMVGRASLLPVPPASGVHHAGRGGERLTGRTGRD